MIRKFTFSEHFNSQYYKGTISFFPGDDTNQTYYDSFSSLFFSGPVGIWIKIHLNPNTRILGLYCKRRRRSRSNECFCFANSRYDNRHNTAFLDILARPQELMLSTLNNYKTLGEDNISSELKKAFPNGIDLYFDNVGGKHLEAAIHNMDLFGRIVLCGSTSTYNTVTDNTSSAIGPLTLSLAISHRLGYRVLSIQIITIC